MPPRAYASSSPTFKVNLHFQLTTQAEPTSKFDILHATLQSLQADLFPYYSFLSLTTFLIVAEIVIFFVADVGSVTIKPGKGFNDVLPWVLAPFAGQACHASYGNIEVSTSEIGLAALLSHIFFSLIIIA